MSSSSTVVDMAGEEGEVGRRGDGEAKLGREARGGRLLVVERR
jgi:hypothetical protein